MTQRRRTQTLNVFVQALEGMRVVVELRRDTIIRGLLQEVRHRALPRCNADSISILPVLLLPCELQTHSWNVRLFAICS